MPVVTEVTDPRCVELVAQYADMLQIGARNMQNFVLLKEVGKVRKPVLLKRGMSATSYRLADERRVRAVAGQFPGRALRARRAGLRSQDGPQPL